MLKLTLIHENCKSEKHSLIFKEKRKRWRQYRQNHKRKEKWILFIESCSQVWNNSAVVCQQFDHEFITQIWKHILSTGTTIIWISRFLFCKSEKGSRFFHNRNHNFFAYSISQWVKIQQNLENFIKNIKYLATDEVKMP